MRATSKIDVDHGETLDWIKPEITMDRFTTNMPSGNDGVLDPDLRASEVESAELWHPIAHTEDQGRLWQLARNWVDAARWEHVTAQVHLDPKHPENVRRRTNVSRDRFAFEQALTSYHKQPDTTTSKTSSGDGIGHSDPLPPVETDSAGYPLFTERDGTYALVLEGFTDDSVALVGHIIASLIALLGDDRIVSAMDADLSERTIKLRLKARHLPFKEAAAQFIDAKANTVIPTIDGVQDTPPFSDAHWEIREILAEQEHATWSSWMTYFLTEKCDEEFWLDRFSFPRPYRDALLRLAETTYPDLSDEQKDNDRREVDAVLPQVLAWARSHGAKV